MLEFCPYDFEKINFNNLAYEAVFFENEESVKWTWEDVEDLVGEEKIKKIKSSIKEKSPERRRFFNIKDKNEAIKKYNIAEPLMFLASGMEGGKNGLERFIELLEENQSITENGMPKKSLKYGGEENGEVLFQRSDGELIMRAVPCCPYCHNRLPVGWMKAEDFGAIALMAPTGGGKTTFLYSMIHDDWNAIGELSGNGLEEISVTSAHWDDDIIYRDLLKAAKIMCRSQGECPDNTIKTMRIPPIFLRLEYGEHCFIMGIYDNAGEHLQNMKANDPKIQILLNKMFAQMFLFDPQNLNIEIPKVRQGKLKSKLKECKILPLQEQGDFQSQNERKSIKAKELLDMYGKLEDEEKDPMKVYRSYMGLVQKKDCKRYVKQMHFFGILIKSDLLEGTEKVKNSNGKYDELFNRSEKNDMLDLNAITIRSNLVLDMMEEFQLFDHHSKEDFERFIDKFKRDFGEINSKGEPTGRMSVSWHCISALGCDTDENGCLKGKYDPIRVLEPMTLCIMKFISEKGWIKE